MADLLSSEKDFRMPKCGQAPLRRQSLRVWLLHANFNIWVLPSDWKASSSGGLKSNSPGMDHTFLLVNSHRHDQIPCRSTEAQKDCCQTTSLVFNSLEVAPHLHFIFYLYLSSFASADNRSLSGPFFFLFTDNDHIASFHSLAKTNLANKLTSLKCQMWLVCGWLFHALVCQMHIYFQSYMEVTFLKCSLCICISIYYHHQE